jgi:Fibronectin type III domain
VTGLHVTSVTSTSVSLDWDSDPSGDRLYYRLYTYAADGTTLLEVHNEPTSLGTSSGLVPGTVYVFRASAVFSAGEGPQSNPVTQRTTGGSAGSYRSELGTAPGADENSAVLSAAGALFGSRWQIGLLRLS